MTMPRVTGYVTIMRFGDHLSHSIQLIEEGHQIGSISFTDPAQFSATIDMLRNEGPYIYWDEANNRLVFGLEPTGEEEG